MGTSLWCKLLKLIYLAAVVVKYERNSRKRSLLCTPILTVVTPRDNPVHSICALMPIIIRVTG